MPRIDRTLDTRSPTTELATTATTFVGVDFSYQSRDFLANATQQCTLCHKNTAATRVADGGSNTTIDADFHPLLSRDLRANITLPKLVNSNPLF